MCDYSSVREEEVREHYKSKHQTQGKFYCLSDLDLEDVSTSLNLFHFDNEEQYKSFLITYAEAEALLFSKNHLWTGSGWYNMTVETEFSYNHGEEERLEPEPIAKTLEQWELIQEEAKGFVSILKELNND